MTLCSFKEHYFIWQAFIKDSSLIRIKNIWFIVFNQGWHLSFPFILKVLGFFIPFILILLSPHCWNHFNKHSATSRHFKFLARFRFEFPPAKNTEFKKFRTNISQEFRFVEDSLELQRQHMVEIGSTYRRLRIRTVEANAFKVKGINNWDGLKKFGFIGVRIMEVPLHLYNERPRRRTNHKKIILFL